MPIESEPKKFEIPQITEEMIGAEAHDDVAMGNSHDLENDAKFEITPELIEKVMAKVKDINSDGTAFTGLAFSSELVWKDGKPKFAKKGYIRINGQEIEANEKNLKKLNDETLLSVLRYGLLGRKFFGRAEETEKRQDKENINLKDRWIKEAKKERTAVLFANIIGRDISNLASSFFNSPNCASGRFGVIYNLNKYTETFPVYCHNMQQGNLLPLAKTQTFRELHGGLRSPLSSLTNAVIKALGISTANLDWKTFVDTIKSRKNEIASIIDNKENYQSYVDRSSGEIAQKFNNVDSYIVAVEEAGNFTSLMGTSFGEDGYMITHRVAPRKFEGIIVKFRNGRYKMPAEKREYVDDEVLIKEETDSVVEEVVEVMAKASKDSDQDRLFPVYDIHGNLLWPKKISYEEVKKFVAERDKIEKEI